MRQRELKLTLNGPGTRTTPVVYRRYQPQADWWFRQIRENLDADPPPKPASAPAQDTFHWR